jgi:hypothetical protein
VVVLVTPHIVRMRDDDKARYPKPVYPEVQDLAREYGDVPIIKPVRYEASGVDIRPESPKEMQDAKDDTAPDVTATPVPTPAPDAMPLAPRASGGMPSLQPVSEGPGAAATSIRPVDPSTAAPHVQDLPASAPSLSPPSTLP